MTIGELQQKILRLKEEKKVFLLAHSYVGREITEIADVVGDSFQLACSALRTQAETVLVCGVRFMAETVKILSPEKRVLLANPMAGCPMAEQLSPSALSLLKARHPDAAVVAYVNTTAELKAMSDVSVTSSSAVKVLSRLKEKEVLFVPDCNLGRFCQKQLPEKTFYFFDGGCPSHMRASAHDVERMKGEHPHALLLVHPECREEVSSRADYVGSTSGIMSFVKGSEAQEFIIGTENSIAEHLQYEYPTKKFYPLSKELVCNDMRLTTLQDVFDALSGGGKEIVLKEEVRLAAKRSLERMIELGG